MDAQLQWYALANYTNIGIVVGIQDCIVLWGESTGDRWIPRTRASNAENASIWWRHHDMDE